MTCYFAHVSDVTVQQFQGHDKVRFNRIVWNVTTFKDVKRFQG